jgi:hypothetical protein
MHFGECLSVGLLTQRSRPRPLQLRAVAHLCGNCAGSEGHYETYRASPRSCSRVAVSEARVGRTPMLTLASDPNGRVDRRQRGRRIGMRDVPHVRGPGHLRPRPPAAGGALRSSVWSRAREGQGWQERRERRQRRRQRRAVIACPHSRGSEPPHVSRCDRSARCHETTSSPLDSVAAV